MLLQRILIIARLLAQRAHKVGVLGVRGHVRAQSRLAGKIFAADGTRESPLARVDHNVRVQVRSGRELFVTKFTTEFVVVVVIGGSYTVIGGGKVGG